jgi:hypothetical protein
VEGRGRDALDDELAVGEPRAGLAEAHDADAHPVLFVGVGEVEQAVLCEVGVERESHQAALAPALDVGDDGERLGSQTPLLVDAHAAGSLREEHPAVGREDD